MLKLLALTLPSVFYFVAQATPAAGSGGSDPWSQLASIGIGSLVALPFIISWRSAAKRVTELEARLESRDQAALHREQELNGTALPVIGQAAIALQSVQQGMSAVADQRRSELDEALRIALLQSLADKKAIEGAQTALKAKDRRDHQSQSDRAAIDRRNEDDGAEE